MKNHEKVLVNYSREMLDESLNTLDDSILLRLRQSRQLAVKAALDKSKKADENHFLFPNWLAPASMGTAFATIALSIVLFWTQPLPQKSSPNGFIEDINLLSQNDELEMFQNLEFYIWLEDETSS